MSPGKDILVILYRMPSAYILSPIHQLVGHFEGGFQLVTFDIRAPNKFRINSKNYFLTFPRCSLSKDDVLHHLIILNYRTNLKYMRVCRELHNNGEPHLHILLQFTWGNYVAPIKGFSAYNTIIEQSNSI